MLTAAALGGARAAVVRRGALRRGTSASFEPIARVLRLISAAALSHQYALSVYVTTLAAILVLLPGSLTAAMARLSSQHLVSGTSRLTGAAVQFLGLAFSVVMGTRRRVVLGHRRARHAVRAAAVWTEWVALVAAPLAFTVFACARATLDYPWILFTGVLAVLLRTARDATVSADAGSARSTACRSSPRP